MPSGCESAAESCAGPTDAIRTVSMVVEPGGEEVSAVDETVTLGDKSKFAHIGAGSANHKSAAALNQSRKRCGGQQSRKALDMSTLGDTKDGPSGWKPGPTESAQGSQTKTPM